MGIEFSGDLRWEEWCNAVATPKLEKYYASHLNNYAIERILKNSNLKRKFKKEAISFSGKIADGWIPVEYSIEWKE